ncbi:arylesterase [Marinibacterium sp. SX1]|uniref:arylesterase n=1 Tax=Marinibacterium sp. SX1 TaxID=3388424 RepID=UPI003D173A0A
MRKIGRGKGPLGALVGPLAAPLAAFLVSAGAGHAETVIAALGDSLTQGHGLPPERGFVPQLEHWLVDHGADVRMINSGVSGDTTAGGAARVGWTLGDEVQGLIVALGANDLLRGIAPEVARQNLEAILDAAEEADVPVLLVGFEAPLNYGAEYKAAFDAIYPDLAASHDVVYADNFFAGVLDIGASPEALAPYLQADRLHPNADGVALIVEGLGPKVLELVTRAED